MVSKVLIATDGSAHGNKAVAFGADIAAKYGADLVLVHVLLRGEYSENMRHMAEVEHMVAEGGRPLAEAFASVPVGRFPTNMILSAENATTPERVLFAIGEQVLDQAAAIAHEKGVKSIKKRLEDGDPVQRILDVIESEEADLVITGARGLSDLKALLVGSVSHKISHLSPVTCVTVR